jgi:hypothetical protein
MFVVWKTKQSEVGRSSAAEVVGRNECAEGIDFGGEWIVCEALAR